MPPRRVARSVSRKSAPLSPPPRASSPGSAHLVSRNLRVTRSASREVIIAQHQLPVQDTTEPLSTLSEEANPRQDEGLSDQRSSSLEPSSQGSDLISLAERLDRDAIIEDLDLLYRDSQDVLKFFEGRSNVALRQLLAQLEVPNSSQRKQFDKRDKRLLASMDSYGSSPYIEVGQMLYILVGESNPQLVDQGPWRPDPIFYLTNLAQQLCAVLSEHFEDPLDCVQYMYNKFPSPFADSVFFPIGEGLLEQTVDMDVTILTHAFIRAVEVKKSNEGVPDLDPREVLEETFLEDHTPRSVFEHSSTRRKIAERKELIRRYFRGNDLGSVDVEGLHRDFPWSEFVFQVAKWSMARKQELDELITARGGVDTIKRMLSAIGSEDTVEVAEEARSEPKTATSHQRDRSISELGVVETVRRRGSPAGPSTGNKLSSRYNRLKALRATHAADVSGADISLAMVSETESARVIPESPTAAENGDSLAQNHDESDAQNWRPLEASPEGNDRDDDNSIDVRQADLILEIVGRHKALSEKENKKVTPRKRSFLDPQEGAEKVPWEEADEDDPPPPRRAQKRPRAMTASSEDEEDGFQTDQRDLDSASLPDIRDILAESRQNRNRRQSSTAGDAGQDAHDQAEEQAEDEIVELPPPAQPSNRQRLHSNARGPDHVPPSTAPQPQRQPLAAQSRTQRSPRAVSNPPGFRELPPSLEAPPNPHRPPPSTAPVRPGPGMPYSNQEPPRSQIAQVNQAAKLTTRLAREVYNPLDIQVRRPYTDAEVDRLMELVALYGPKWALILKRDRDHPDGPLLQNRTQVQLKDKARNIKLDFLKARRPLPPRFELVSIGSRQVAMLQQLGIDVHESRHIPEDG
ncbi:hypothetical protein ABEF95_009887 [Exophiala dermatitidis]